MVKIKSITKTRNQESTKIFMVFFVFSDFRAFVMNDLYIFRFIRVSIYMLHRNQNHILPG